MAVQIWEPVGLVEVKFDFISDVRRQFEWVDVLINSAHVSPWIGSAILARGEHFDHQVKNVLVAELIALHATARESPDNSRLSDFLKYCVPVRPPEHGATVLAQEGSIAEENDKIDVTVLWNDSYQSTLAGTPIPSTYDTRLEDTADADVEMRGVCDPMITEAYLEVYPNHQGRCTRSPLPVPQNGRKFHGWGS